MKIEYNSKMVVDPHPLLHKGIMVTPPIGEDYWIMRVPLSDKQAIVAFPKFGTIGIGFQQEEDWNTNLPYACPAKEIFSHISHNKGDNCISDEACIQAIQMIQDEIKNCFNLRFSLPN